ncbi:MAG TPA: hypothetical protein VGJ13_18570 [Pseudonocardiaceae bacterium]|jgi:hypothetical protein
MIRIRLTLAVVGLSLLTSLVLAPPAAADNCDIFINPEDCQNTGWTIGVIATLAGGVAVATAATAAGGRSGGSSGDVEPREPVPPPPAGSLITGPARPDRRRRPAAEDIDIQPTSDPPSITIEPPDGTVRSHSVTLEAHHDPGWQTVQEVNRDHD